MPDLTVARIPVSFKEQDLKDLSDLRDKLEKQQDKRLSVAEVVRTAIRIALDSN